MNTTLLATVSPPLLRWPCCSETSADGGSRLNLALYASSAYWSSGLSHYASGRIDAAAREVTDEGANVLPYTGYGDATYLMPSSCPRPTPPALCSTTLDS
ncbi:hypothetical protein [Mycobacterium sp.]|jgi:hypothetical protein|uniref:hypothetical protein n=1 Tax=Mycobacterium sp. TaxID=1785 RepID=UPI0028B28251|nr:hypothetical protein [Mycobacterium sp.]MDT5130941.1 hypothetical protein [Mycobacterium sp.]